MAASNGLKRGTRERYHWLETGDPGAPTMVLAHGYMAHSMAFRRVTDALAEHYRLVIVDLPAHGRDESYRHHGVEPTIDSLTDWLRDFRDDVLGGEPAHWVGHSLGANLAYRLAREAPDQVRSLALVSPGVRVPPQPLVARALDRLPARFATLGANRLGLSLYQPLNWRGAPMTRDEARAYLEPMRSADRMNFILRLGARILEGNHTPLDELALPSVVIWGEHDHILPLEDAWHVGERVGADVHIVPGSGHSPMEDAPAAFIEIMSRFLGH